MKKKLIFIFICLLLFGCAKEEKSNNLVIINDTENIVKSIAYDISGNPKGLSHADGSPLKSGERLSDYVDSSNISIIVTDLNNKVYTSNIYKIDTNKKNCFTITRDNSEFKYTKGCKNE